jgi:GIY-YIG catalytic domain
MSVFPIKSPERLFSRTEVLGRPSPVPATSGLYAWYFRNVPPVISTDGCLTLDGGLLLYLGIAPDRANKPNSRATLLSRIRQHYRGNAEGSTLRRTLGVLLEEQSGYSLRRVGSGKRITLSHAGEQWLDEWTEKNAFVAWTAHPEPWLVEHELLTQFSCPLNIMGNRQHPFSATLRGARISALQRARELPIANEHNQSR